MSETKAIFTQGPWGYDESHTNAISIIAGRREIASVYEEKKRDVDDEMRANARLIAAAPDLLKVAKHFEQCIEFEIASSRRNGDEEGARLKTVSLNRTRAAIAKAVGA